jgi:thioredoxin-like negative regulator of GroEL
MNRDSANTACAQVNNDRDLTETLRVKERVIAIFYASWCPFCAKFLPIFMKHASREGRGFILVQDDQEAMADRYAVKIYPTVLFFERGVVLKRLDGVAGVGLDEKQLTGFIDSCSLSPS